MTKIENAKLQEEEEEEEEEEKEEEEEEELSGFILITIRITMAT